MEVSILVKIRKKKFINGNGSMINKERERKSIRCFFFSSFESFESRLLIEGILEEYIEGSLGRKYILFY